MYFDRQCRTAGEGGREESPGQGCGQIWLNARKHDDEGCVCLRVTEGQSATQNRCAASADVLLQLVEKSDYVP